jgi:hypothetical protein
LGITPTSDKQYVYAVRMMENYENICKVTCDLNKEVVASWKYALYKFGYTGDEIMGKYSDEVVMVQYVGRQYSF